MPTAGKRTRGLKGARRTQGARPLFTGGIVSGSSTQTGSLTANAGEAITNSVIGGTTGNFKTSSGTNSFVNTPNGQADGASGAESSGAVAAGITTTANMGPSTQDASLTTNTAGSFLAGFSPANVVGTTTILQASPSGIQATPVIFVEPNGFTGGSGASSGNIGITTALTNPSLTTDLNTFASGAGEVSSFGKSTASNVLGDAGSISKGTTNANAASALDLPAMSRSDSTVTSGGTATAAFAETGFGVFGGPRPVALNQFPLPPATTTTAGGPFTLLPSN